LPVFDEVHIVCRLALPVQCLPLESGHVFEL
jgi:hypothetical protein